MSTPEPIGAYDAFYTKHTTTPATYGFVGRQIQLVMKVFGTVMKEYVAKQLAEARPNAELEMRLARLDDLIVLYEARIKALEANTTTRGLSWAGDHAAGKSYRAGEFCKRNGSVWLATRDTEASPGLAPADWELVVKGQAHQ